MNIKNGKLILSDGAGAIFITYCLLWIIANLLRTCVDASTGHRMLIAAVVLLLIALFRWACWNSLVVRGRWRVYQSWYEGSSALAVVLFAYFFITSTTGYVPSRYAGHYAAPGEAMMFAYQALMLLIVAGGALLLEWRESRSTQQSLSSTPKKTNKDSAP